ncbi:hypothetical protein HZH66_003560 [Vespula vulgaris]|uniref:Uncharacterized protein n=1 Tax=Vespula vulgaris TaxID=7454 RepID=A0A834KH16_VESVU|nr:hypothetical protein HZH66_003560 [Vespula vulgaris]
MPTAKLVSSSSWKGSSYFGGMGRNEERLDGGNGDGGGGDGGGGGGCWAVVKALVAPSAQISRSPGSSQYVKRYGQLCKKEQKYLRIIISETTPSVWTFYRSSESNHCALYAHIFSGGVRRRGEETGRHS